MVPFWVGCAFIRLPFQSRACLWDLLQQFLYFSYRAAPNLFFQSTKTFQSGSEQLMTKFPFRSELLLTGEWFFFLTKNNTSSVVGLLAGRKATDFIWDGASWQIMNLKDGYHSPVLERFQSLHSTFCQQSCFWQMKKKPSSNCTKYIKLSYSS